MFLPVLLVRDYGLVSWFVFAVPNVVGAAAMGFVLRRQRSSEELVERHLGAMLAFSLVTVAFHGFFLGWFFSTRDVPMFPLLALVCGMIGAAWLSFARWRRADRIVAAVLWLMSFAALLWVSHYRFSNHIALPSWYTADSSELAWLAPVCVIGFVCSPMLDLTFHRARQGCSTRGARFAFALGFVVLFTPMIAFTVVFGDLLDISFVAPAVVATVLWHILLQSTVTTALHLREVGARAPKWAPVGIVVALGAAVLGATVRLDHAGLSSGEIGYRVFMAFYGLVAPAYVWTSFGRRPSVGLLLVTVLAATPFYWLGFIERQEAWLGVGVLIVVAARLLSPRPEPVTASVGPR
jgi:hypothetical protein